MTFVSSQRLTPAFLAISGGILLLASMLVGESLYHPDSWSYFELARTVFSGDFYKANTIRSYWSGPYSASFPLGYPVLLAAGQLFVGQKPLLAVWLNIAAALSTWCVLRRACTQLGVSPFLGFALATSLLAWPLYLDEVLNGGAMPMALLSFACACSAGLAGWHFTSGLLLGCAALVRFDYLAFGVLYQVAALWFWRARDARRLLLLVPGFLLGLTPWLLYSLLHFDRVWASDNSWIALSATRAYVTDFPASARASAFDAPGLWLSRVASNIPTLVRLVAASSLRWPLAPLLAVLFVVRFLRFDASAQRRALLLLALLCASLSPYLLTGYFAPRYFSLPLLAASILFAHFLEASGAPKLPHASTWLIAGALALSGTLAIFRLVETASDGVRDVKDTQLATEQIRLISRCQSATPNVRYVFAGSMSHLTAKYGAVTGLPTAFIPGNFQRMTATEKDHYFDMMKPYVLVDSPPQADKCLTPR